MVRFDGEMATLLECAKDLGCPDIPHHKDEMHAPGAPCPAESRYKNALDYLRRMHQWRVEGKAKQDALEAIRQSAAVDEPIQW